MEVELRSFSIGIESWGVKQLVQTALTTKREAFANNFAGSAWRPQGCQLLGGLTDVLLRTDVENNAFGQAADLSQQQCVAGHQWGPTCALPAGRFKPPPKPPRSGARSREPTSLTTRLDLGAQRNDAW